MKALVYTDIETVVYKDYEDPIIMPGESLTEYIERRRREFESKADGGAIGIEVLFTEKDPRKNFFMGGPALTGTALDIFNSLVLVFMCGW